MITAKRAKEIIINENTKDFVCTVTSALKKSIRIKNLILCAFMVPLLGMSIVFWIVAGVPQFAPISSTGMSLFTTVSIIILLLTIPLIILVSTIIRNVQNSSLKKNLVFSVKKLPRLMGISLILIAIFIAINFTSNQALSIQAIKSQNYPLSSDLYTDIWEGSKALGIELHTPPLNTYMRLLKAADYPTVFRTFMLPPGGLMMTALALLVMFAFFFVFQEAVIADKSILKSFWGALKRFQKHYLLIPVIWLTYSLVNVFLLRVLLMIVPPLVGDVFYSVAIFSLAEVWVFLFQLVLMTEFYLKKIYNPPFPTKEG